MQRLYNIVHVWTLKEHVTIFCFLNFCQSCKTVLLHCMYKAVFHNIATLPFSFFRKNLNKLNHLKKIILRNGPEQE
jgi:hypothetical protein